MNQIVTKQSLVQITIIALVVSLFLAGCNQDVHNVKLNEIERLSITPGKFNHGVVISINGTLDCPVTLHMLIGENRNKPPFVLLRGQVDTTVRMEWYQNKLGFELEKGSDCVIQDDMKVRVEMLDFF